MKAVIAILLLCFVSFVEPSDLVCSSGKENASIAISSETESNVWAVGVPDIQLTVNISCPKNFLDDLYTFYLIKSGEIFNSSPFASIYLDDWFNKSVGILSFKWLYEDKTVTMYINLSDPTNLGSLLTLAIKNKHSKLFFYSRPLAFENCTTSVLQSELLPVDNYGRFYMYQDVLTTTCKDGLLFVEDKYENVMNVTCGRYVKWEIPKYKCLPGCVISQLPIHLRLYSTLGQPYVLSGNIVGVSCKSSVLKLFVGGEYETTINATCGRDSTWETPKHVCSTGCATSQPPRNLQFQTVFEKPYVHSDYTATVLCNSLFLFVDGRYNPSIYATCGRDSVWKTSNAYECAVGCPHPSSLFQTISGPLKSSRYKVFTVFNVKCQTGRLYHTGTTKYFLTDTRIVCKSTGDWDVGNVGCWKDPTVDFTVFQQTLLSDKNTTFACASTSVSLEVRITVGENVFKSKLAAWREVTISSNLNQVNAVCEVINAAGFVVQKSATLLNVQYSPELLNSVEELQFGLQQGRSGRVIIKFMSNPILLLSYITVKKNETKIQNYYLTNEDFTHRVIVDFSEVQDTDFGDYVITVTSFSPVKRILETNFTIFQSKPSSEPLTVSAVAAITLAVVIGVALLIVAVFVSKKMLKKYEATKATETNETSHTVVDNAKEPHNYEDSDEKSDEEDDDDEFDDDSDNNDVNNKGYDNVDLPGTSPHYEDVKGRPSIGNNKRYENVKMTGTTLQYENPEVRPSIENVHVGVASEHPIYTEMGVALKLPIGRKIETALKPATGRGRGVALKLPTSKERGVAVKPSTGRGREVDLNPHRGKEKENLYMAPIMPK